MRCGSVYLVVKDFDKSLDFYEKVFEIIFSVLVLYFYGSGWQSN